MKTATRITLNALPKHDGGEAVTTRFDGTVLSKIFDLEWDFSGQERGSLTTKPVVAFSHIEPAYRKVFQSTLAVLMKTQEVRQGGIVTRSQVSSWLAGLRYIKDILGSCDWERLSDDGEYAKFKRELKKRVQASDWSETTVSSIISAINKLNESSMCSRVPNGNEIRGWVNKKMQQHIAIPLGMYQPIMATALELVEMYHPHRHAINEAQFQLEKIAQEERVRTDVSTELDAIHSRERKRTRNLSHTIPDFKLTRTGSELNKIQDACAIVILGFSGMRVGEMTSMTKDSYIEKGCNHIPTLIGQETKRSGHVIHETWQTHKVSKYALELSCDMTQFLRSIYEEENSNNLSENKISFEEHQRRERQIASAFLSTKISPNRKNYCQVNMSRRFNKFIQRNNIVATEADVEEFNRLNPTRAGQLKVGGRLPKLSPHDIRRSFAVFIKRYGFGSSATIKFQYKHSNIQMSDYYGNNARLQAMEDVLMDNDLLQLMNEEGIRMGVDIFDEIFNESQQLGGAGGERIARDKFERLSSGEHVYMTRGEIERLVRNGTLSVVKLPTGGYCTNASCSRVCGIGEFAAEIKPCDDQVITDKQAELILKQNKRIIKAFRDLNTGDPMMNSILIGQKQKIRRNERLIEGFNLSFEPFNDEIKGIIEIAEV
ncbi:tyrosine-type recombinase/integrase [Alteromonas macleodii]|jgi:integrase|uniref:Phage integrase family protein n=1 Tax=Alteromonas macleodii (strain English Channel 673) TaxID=1004788 RepID=A0AB32ZUE2_ALTME|nr:tyrosine-type recombinase/integrase [Alteromonas macleodii]AFT73190.1 hypothetical protein AMEC673_02445 [Alteromonas macleodii str. 'English Channel 673']MAE22098.1 hypothetical protein [Pseudomonas sp.]